MQNVKAASFDWQLTYTGRIFSEEVQETAYEVFL